MKEHRNIKVLTGETDSLHLNEGGGQLVHPTYQQPWQDAPNQTQCVSKKGELCHSNYPPGQPEVSEAAIIMHSEKPI